MLASSDRRLVALSFLALAGATASCSSVSDGAASRSTTSAVSGLTTIGGVRITNYVLARESELSGGGAIGVSGLSRAYPVDFLCSGHGVAMQGTGIGEDGVYVKYVSGGGGWCGGYARLCNCASARFAEVDHVYGASGRALVKHHSIAVDPTLIPLGSSVWIAELGRWFRADDTGGAIVGRHIDVYTEDEHPHYSSQTEVVVTSTPHAPDDPGPNGEVVVPLGSGPGPSGEPEPRPEGGPFPALDIRHPVGSGEWVTQCNHAGDGERAWLTRAGGRDAYSRWAEAKYPQEALSSCGEAREGKRPLVFRSAAAGTLGAAWITTCSDEPGVAHVFQVDGEVDGRPAAGFHHDERDESCQTR